MNKRRTLTAALGGTPAALVYVLLWDPWTFFGAIGFVLAAVIGGWVGWVHGPKSGYSKRRKERMEAYKEELRKDGYDV